MLAKALPTTLQKGLIRTLWAFQGTLYAWMTVPKLLTTTLSLDKS